MNFICRLSERRVIVGCLIVFCSVFIITIPWPFIGETIPYQEQQTNNTNKVKDCQLNNTKKHETPIGCPQNFKWCATTHRVNVYLYTISFIIALGKFCKKIFKVYSK